MTLLFLIAIGLLLAASCFWAASIEREAYKTRRVAIRARKREILHAEYSHLGAAEKNRLFEESEK